MNTRAIPLPAFRWLMPLLLGVLLLAPHALLWAQDEAPGLPAGLESGGEPSLPAGLGDSGETPSLPQGLGEDAPSPGSGADEGEVDGEEDESMGRWGGFAELRGGRRFREDPSHKRTSLAEARLQLEGEWQGGGIALRLKTDLLYDQVAENREEENTLELERGRGWLDLREANGAFAPLSFLDVKAGRQIITWGTGDLLFINDLFPKDYRSFFLGRDEEYLKAPSDALKLSGYSPWVNADLVYSPRFDPDRYVDGSRLSYYDPALGQIAASPVVADLPHKAGEDDEWAMRLHGVLGTVEGALYGYRGFWKSPAGMDPATGHATFPRLAVNGASLRGPLAGGLANLEGGAYRSLDDPDGDDPFVRNGETRVMAGYEREALRNLTLGVQYYHERMRHYTAYVESLSPGAEPAERDRRLWTLRLTWLTFNQNLTWSWFTFYTPQDEDAYHRAKVRYAASDDWSLEMGANLFGGERDDGFFNQFRHNENAYGALRYSF